MSLLAGRRPANLGAKDGRLAPPKRTPNCVSSQADPADAEHYVAPIAFAGTDGEAMAAARRAIASMERSTIVSESPGYLYAEFRSKLLGYVDDLELLFDGPGQRFHVRSASRLGRRDFGVNRKRVEALRERLQGLSLRTPGDRLSA
ncbi:MAG: DUF1499 domain-containing protein [Betaproteobacteria bacterium]|nr:DUF1499 domain-containing protein [Betaproteobacteria bacterium]